MKRNTLILITGVLLFGGLFGLTATATAADTAGPADFPQNISVDPGVENTANNFTFMANLSQSTDTTNITDLSVNFSQASGVNESNIMASQVTVDANNTTTSVNSVSRLQGVGLVINLASNFTLDEVDTYVNVSIDNVMVPENGTFDGNLSFWEIGGAGVVANHTSSYTIAQAPSPTLKFMDQEPTANNGVTVMNATSDGVDTTIVITYMNDGNLTIVGETNGTYMDETVEVPLSSTAGFPGNHTAHILPTSDVSSQTASGMNVSAATQNNVSDSQQAYVSVDVGGDGTVARDTTDDGLLNDVNGDMSFDILDVQALFTNLGSMEFANYPSYFEFSGSGDGDVDIFDVQALYGWFASP